MNAERETAKERNKLRLVEADRSQAILSRCAVERILERSDPFHFHFQPIVDLSHGVTVGYEALVRFTPGTTALAPDQVFHAAGVHGLRGELEELTLREAFRSRGLLPKNCFYTINVGPAFALSEAFDRLIEEQTTLGGVIVEITEEEEIRDYPAIQRTLALIRAKAGCIAVDDAGSGFASLQHIMEMRPNFIKLDRAFISGCGSDPAKAVLIEMLGKAASKLDAWVIAEGVETESELHELVRLGVPLAQGYFLARPSAGMTVLDRSVSQMVQRRSEAVAVRGRLERAIDPVPTCAEREAAQALVRQLPVCSAVVVLNHFGQVLEVFEHHPHLGARNLPQVTRVQARSQIQEVLQRALSRPAAQRYDPLVATDELGRLAGVISMDRLVQESLFT